MRWLKFAKAVGYAAVNGRKASPHQVSETSVACGPGGGFAVAYILDGDDRGGVDVNGGEHPS